MQGEKNSKKSKQRNKWEKIVIDFKKLKLKKKRRGKETKKEELHRTAKTQNRSRGLLLQSKMWLKKKSLKNNKCFS